MDEATLKSLIRDIPDFPKAGILFRDITPLLADAPAFAHAITRLAAAAPPDITHVAGIEARGFIFAPAVAQAIGAAFIPIRKPNKLPHHTITATYQLEYGTDSLAMHRDAIEKGARVLIIDDLIATGGTLTAAINLVHQCEAEVAKVACLIELTALGGREAIAPTALESIITY